MAIADGALLFNAEQTQQNEVKAHELTGLYLKMLADQDIVACYCQKVKVNCRFSSIPITGGETSYSASNLAQFQLSYEP